MKTGVAWRFFRFPGCSTVIAFFVRKSWSRGRAMLKKNFQGQKNPICFFFFAILLESIFENFGHFEIKTMTLIM
jgi:hypothetical protein